MDIWGLDMCCDITGRSVLPIIPDLNQSLAVQAPGLHFLQAPSLQPMEKPLVFKQNGVNVNCH